MRNSLSSKGMATVRGTRRAALLLGLAVGLAASIGPAQADKVGVAAAVNPDAFSNLSGTPNKQLNIGKSIFFNERINTTTSGLVQVLLVDGSTFTVGPNSDLVIDKFVYNPRKKTGEIVATFSKGTMRFIGGKLSKNEGGVKVNTPAGALAIRGGMFQGRVTGNKGSFSFLYGVSLTYSNNGQTQTVYEQGYTLDTTSGTPTIRPTTPEDTNFFTKAFSGGGTVVVGGSGDQPTPNQPTLTETISLQDLISDATATQIDSTLQQEEEEDPPPINNTPTTPTTTTTTTTTTTPTTTTPTETPPPTQLTLRVLNPPGTFTAFPGTPGQEFTTHDHMGILGGDDLEGVNVDDFERTFSIVNDRLVGTVTGLVDSFPGESGPETRDIADASVDFPAKPNCVKDLGLCPVTGATITQNGETTTYEGLAVLRTDFYAYHVIDRDLFGLGNGFNVENIEIDQDNEDTPEALLAFGGKGYNFGTPSGRAFGFLLTPDVREGVFAPFASWESAPEVAENKPQPFVTPLLYKETDGSNPDSKAVWLQTSLYINTTPAGDDVEFDQESFVNIALGGIGDGGLVGARRGGSQLGTYNGYDGPGCQGEGHCKGLYREEPESYAFTGDIASLEGPDGSHFLGKDQPNIVIGFDSTGTHNIGRDIPLDPESSDVEDQSGSTYHIGIGQGTLESQPQTFDGTFQGYAVGIVRSDVPEEDFANVVASRSPDDFGITFNPTTNTLSANLTVYDVQRMDDATGKYELGFGDDPLSPENRSAFIDNLHYAAIESGDAQVSNWDYDGGFEDYDYSTATSYLVSGEQLGVTQFFPDTFEETSEGSGVRPFCTDCEFIKWGAWGTRVEFGDDDDDPYVNNVHLGWWVAGDTTSTAALDNLATDNMTATYNGHAIGNVSNNLKTYVAAGDLQMDWSFASRTGNFAISKFDRANFGSNGLTFSGGLCAPGIPGCSFSADGNHFKGGITGVVSGNVASGIAAGSFVNDVARNPARGAIGNWNVGTASGAYRATGIFAGSGTPIPGTVTPN